LKIIDIAIIFDQIFKLKEGKNTKPVLYNIKLKDFRHLGTIIYTNERIYIKLGKNSSKRARLWIIQNFWPTLENNCIIFKSKEI